MSIKTEPGQLAVIYPAEPGTPNGPCLDERCGHFDCNRMRKDAAALCPECQHPVGYGSELPMKPLQVPDDWLFFGGGIGLIHLACNIARHARYDAEHPAKPEAATVPETAEVPQSD